MKIIVAVVAVVLMLVLYAQLNPSPFAEDNFLVEAGFNDDGTCELSVDGVLVTGKDEKYETDIMHFDDGRYLMSCISQLRGDSFKPRMVMGGFVMPGSRHDLPGVDDGLNSSGVRIAGGILNVPFVQEAPEERTNIRLEVSDAEKRNDQGTTYISGTAVRKYVIK